MGNCCISKFDPDQFGEFVLGYNDKRLGLLSCECFEKDKNNLTNKKPLLILKGLKIEELSIKLCELYLELILLGAAAILTILTLGLFLIFTGRPRRIMHHVSRLVLFCPTHKITYNCILELTPQEKSLRFGNFLICNTERIIELQNIEEPTVNIITQFENLDGHYHFLYRNCIVFANELMNYCENLKSSNTRRNSSFENIEQMNNIEKRRKT